MTVKEFIKRLKKCDPDAEVITKDNENDFYSAIVIYEDTKMDDSTAWISIEDKPRPDKIVFVQ